VNKRNPIIEVLKDPTKSFLANFVLGTLIFTIVSDGLSELFWEWIENWAKTQLWMSESLFQLYVRILLVLILLAVIYFTNITGWIADRIKGSLIALGFMPEEKIANVVPLEQTYKGLIVLMSSKPVDSPAEAAVRHHLKLRNQNNLSDKNEQRTTESFQENNSLKYCWIVCTNRTWEYARQMVDRLKQSGAEDVRFYYGSEPVKNVEDAEEMLSLLIPDHKVDDPNHVRKLVEGIYAIAKQQGLDETDIIADYTGGTKGMTAGLLLACTRPARSLQYISQVNYPQIMSVQIAYKLKQRKPADSSAQKGAA